MKKKGTLETMTSKFYKVITWKEIGLIIGALAFFILAILSAILIKGLAPKIVSTICLTCFSGVFSISLYDSIQHKRSTLKMCIKDVDLSKYGVKRRFVFLMENVCNYVDTMREIDKFVKKAFDEDMFYHLEKTLAFDLGLRDDSTHFDMFEPYVIIMIRKVGNVLNKDGKVIQGFQDGNYIEISYSDGEGIAPIFLHEISHYILAKYAYNGDKSHQVIAETIAMLLTK